MLPEKLSDMAEVVATLTESEPSVLSEKFPFSPHIS
jgi:hypothetical protein